MSKYSKDERDIVHKIHVISVNMALLRRKYIEMDIKRLNLVSKLNGKYDLNNEEKKKKSRKR